MDEYSDDNVLDWRTPLPPAQPKSSLPEGYNLVDAVFDTTRSESLINAYWQQAKANAFNADPNWELPDLDTPEWKALTEGIPEVFHDRLAATVSLEHATFIADRIRQEMALSDRTQEFTGGNWLGMLGLSMLNPENIVLGAITPGASWVKSADGVLEAAKRAAIVGGVSAAAVDSVAVSMQETRGWDDVTLSTVAGSLLGFGFGAGGRLLRASEREAFVRDVRAEYAKMQSALGLTRADPAADPAASASSPAPVPRTPTPAPPEAKEALAALSTKLRESLQGPKSDQTATFSSRVNSIANSLKDTDQFAGRVSVERAHAAYQRRHGKISMSEFKKLLLEDPDVRLLPLEEGETMSERQMSRNRIATPEGDYHFVERVAVPEQSGASPLEIALPEVRAELESWAAQYGESAPSGSLDLARISLDIRDGDAAARFLDDIANSMALEPTFVEGGQIGGASVGAAQAGAVSRPLVTPLQGTTRRNIPFTSNNRFRIGPLRDNAAKIHSIVDPELRDAAGSYVGDPAGSQNRKTVPIGADEEAHSLYKIYGAEHSRSYMDAFRKWKKSLKPSFRNYVFDNSLYNEFGEAVTMHRMGYEISNDPNVQKAAAGLDDLYERIRKDAQEAGVAGFDTLMGAPQGQPYRNRVWNKSLIAELASERRFGTQVLEELVAKAFAAANPLADARVAGQVGKAVIMKLRKSEAGIHDAVVGMRMADAEWLNELIDSVAPGPQFDQLRRYLATEFHHMQSKNDLGDGGRVENARHRTLLDESVSVLAMDYETGAQREIRLYDLFDNNADSLAKLYIQRMSGAVGFARRTDVKSPRDHQKLLDRVRSHYADPQTEGQGERIAQAMDQVYRLAHGRTLLPPDTPQYLRAIYDAFRTFRLLAFTTSMNQLWFSALPDSSSWMTYPTARRLFRHFPEVVTMMNEMRKGTPQSLKFAAEIEAFTGLATEGMISDVHRYIDDDTMGRELTGVGAKVAAVKDNVDRQLRRLGRGTGWLGGVYTKHNIDQRLYGFAFGVRLIDAAMGDPKALSPERIASAGLDSQMLGRIKDQLDQHGDFTMVKGGVRMRAANTIDWDDQEAAMAFWSAIGREGRRAVQEEMAGEAPGWLNTMVGRIIGQFRRFSIVSTTKQLLFAVNHRDAETLQKVAIQMTLGWLGYYAQMQLYAATMNEDDREEFLEKYVNNPSAVVWGAFARAGVFAMIPPIALNAYNGLTQQQTNPYIRASGTSAVFEPTSIPSIDKISRFANFMLDVFGSAVRSDRQFDQNEFANIRGNLPWQNMPIIKQILDLVQHSLPEDDEDEDDEEIRWFFQQE